MNGDEYDEYAMLINYLIAFVMTVNGFSQVVHFVTFRSTNHCYEMTIIVTLI